MDASNELIGPTGGRARAVVDLPPNMVAVEREIQRAAAALGKPLRTSGEVYRFLLREVGRDLGLLPLED